MDSDSSPPDPKEIIQIITNYYTFLAHRSPAFIQKSSIKTPPPIGWPLEYHSSFRKMGKSDQIVDLLCHLPYIEVNDREWLGGETKPINYISPLNLRRMDDMENKRYLFEPVEQKIPAHVFSLTNGRLYGDWWLLDILAGTITEFSVLGGPTPEFQDGKWVEGPSWHLYPTKPIKQFFEDCQKKMGG